MTTPATNYMMGNNMHIKRAPQRKVSGPVTTHIEIVGIEHDVVVDFDHSPYEAATRHDPGSDSCIEITAVTGVGNGIALMGYMSTEELEVLEDRVMENIDSGEEW